MRINTKMVTDFQSELHSYCDLRGKGEAEAESPRVPNAKPGALISPLLHLSSRDACTVGSELPRARACR